MFCGGSTKVIISGQYRTTLNNDNKENNAYEDRNSIVKEEWPTSQQTHDRREKIQALSLAKDCYAMKLDILTNATVVDDAIRFVTSIPNNNTHDEAVKPKADACITDSAEDRDIQRPQEETGHRAEDPTTNLVF